MGPSARSAGLRKREESSTKRSLRPVEHGGEGGSIALIIFTLPAKWPSLIELASEGCRTEGRTPSAVPRLKY